jgi:hypothetical protein
VRQQLKKQEAGVRERNLVGWSVVLLAVIMIPQGFTAHAVSSQTTEYQSFDGTGNNSQNPQWGAAGIHLLRGASGSHYGDGISSMGGAERPSPRAISDALMDQPYPVYSSVGHSDYIWTWGQFLDHDLGLTPGVNESEPIPVPTGDPTFDPRSQGGKTIAFKRSVFDPLTGTAGKPREQVNLISGYIDGNTVYGSNVISSAPDRPGWLRTHVDGRMKVTSSAHGDLLPFNDGTVPNVGTPEKPDFSTSLFVAGDIRVNEQPTLACMHTLFVREHNYQAAQLQAANPTLSDEEIYQRARRIVIAEIQAITYEEFIPALLGPNALRPDRGYNPNVNASIAQVFSTAAYRLGHTLLSTSIQHLGKNGESMPGGPLMLRNIFFDPTPPIVMNEGIEPILRGLAVQKSQNLDRHIIDDVRNLLFANEGSGLDLVSLNIQRGRDHGLPDFNTVRTDLGLPRKTSFGQITSEPGVAERMASLYGSIDNIDLFPALLIEDRLPGMIVGETLRAILVDQFERSRDGDRFFYTHIMSGEELAGIRATRLSDIIKRNTGIQNIQESVFFVVGRSNNK